MKLASVLASFTFSLAALTGCATAADQEPTPEPSKVEVEESVEPKVIRSCGDCLEACMVGGGTFEQNLNEYRFCSAACCR